MSDHVTEVLTKYMRARAAQRAEEIAWQLDGTRRVLAHHGIAPLTPEPLGYLVEPEPSRAADGTREAVRLDDDTPLAFVVELLRDGYFYARTI